MVGLTVISLLTQDKFSAITPALTILTLSKFLLACIIHKKMIFNLKCLFIALYRYNYKNHFFTRAFILTHLLRCELLEIDYYVSEVRRLVSALN